ncbi:hypothetical protein K504DRAFT_461541 [Pleomassaria siparia CBS 279.74]|uniref:Secreted protein n=1 Tax=Pleomassaria siparia CBS 279.74 TaxID=1314801 RepID=A0A6G1KJE3_9PLEO|nr:hypothetical protein K504DRAFT_461541 [Pleomassaria siparia CBS 279.74]
MHAARCNLPSVLCTLHAACCTLHSALCTLALFGLTTDRCYRYTAAPGNAPRCLHLEMGNADSKPWQRENRNQSTASILSFILPYIASRMASTSFAKPSR